MTLNDITKQAMQLAVAGYINDQKMTENELKTLFQKMLDRVPGKYIFQISMADGKWFCKAVRDKWGYDLIIPYTREQEHRIKGELLYDPT